ncbi:ATP-dependent DNA helicase RecQ [Lacunisphaera limnophila]|uniref:DNA 3'-5' helicase n=1 Tax=Lacunisphaera limnophila TaxID=1838286 RepID=A0A1D8AYY9_9BACT|nr:protein DpdF [Lacunisphaera limnophila]AOS46099.1 ATP-dependent DNA helicase RecQ [Lacunisphaera limnophila]
MSEFADLKRRLKVWPKETMPGTPYQNTVYERVRLALLNGSSANLGWADLAVLIRQVLRWEATNHAGIPQLTVPASAPWPSKAEWRKCGCVAYGDSGTFELEAAPWQPQWLPSDPLSAAEQQIPRRTKQTVPADPSLVTRFGRNAYLSSNQAEAVRAVMLSPPGAIRLVVLPTGAGKSLVGMAASLLGIAESGGTSVVVVPTIALAFDQVRQARELGAGIPIDAWHSGLSRLERKTIWQRMRDGQQRVIFCAPESIVSGLAETLEGLASSGQLRAFIVDEAHLIGQWGTSFRPEFQSMSALWRKLRRVCPPERRFRTLLMTATLTEDSFADIQRFFGDPEDFEVLSAVYLRQEPRYGQVRCDSAVVRTQAILEALFHAPRPAVLYVTRVEEAETWLQRCRQASWKRVGMLHGECGPLERARTLQAWNANELDLMIGTSAFGLGMDKADVRAVIHACVPETVDRFYQEVGRGGRDGNACASLLIWTEADVFDAKNLSSPQIVGAEIGFQRWQSMWASRIDTPQWPYVNLNAKRPGVKWDGERNREWNLKTLLLLARSGVLEIQSGSPPGSVQKPGEATEAYEARRQEEQIRLEAYVPVNLLQSNPTTALAWDQQVETNRGDSRSSASRNWSRMEDLLRGRRGRDDILREVYQVPGAGIHHVGEGPEDVTLSPTRKLNCEVSANLQQMMAAGAANHLFVTYAANTPQRELFTRLVESLKRLAKNGIREIALPARWRTETMWPGALPNPLNVMTKTTPENFLIVRDLDEPDPVFEGYLAVPRVSVLPPEHAPAPIPEHLYALSRPVHLIIAPEDCADRFHPGRYIGAGTPGAIRLETLLNVLRQ